MRSFFLFFFFCANHCQCQSITVLASINLFTVASTYTLQCICCSKVGSCPGFGESREMDLILDAGARSRSSKTGSLSHPCTVLPVAKLIYAAKWKKEKSKLFFFIFFLLWRFSPRLNSKFALVWLQKKRLFATETWTICASKRLRMGEFQIIKSEVCLQVKNWECVQSLFSFIWAKIKTHSLEQSCRRLFCGETFLFEGCGEWMNVHNKTDKIF